MIFINRCIALTVFLFLFVVSESGSVAQPPTAQPATEQPATEQAAISDNVPNGYDNKNRFQQKLLEFVAPVYTGSSVQDSLVKSLGNSKSKIASSENVIANMASRLSVSTLLSQQQSQLLQLSQELQLSQNKSSTAKTRASFARAGKANAKAVELNAKTELLRTTLESEKELFRVNLERRLESMQNKVDSVNAQQVKFVTAKSGSFQNVLLGSMQPFLLRYGYTLEIDSQYRVLLEKLTIDPSDFDKIQLMLDIEGKPIIFPASKGSGSLGQVPFALRNPQTAPILADIETQLTKIANLKGGDPAFYSEVMALPAFLDQLENASAEALGDAHESAAKGSSSYQVWKMAKDYRDGLWALVYRLQLEGSANILKSRASYDPALRGNGLLPFVTFMVSNGCRFAPAKPGDEATYTRLQILLLKLQAIIED